MRVREVQFVNVFSFGGQIKSSNGMVDARRLRLQQDLLERVMGRREMGATMKAVGAAYRWFNLKQFGILNQKAAANNLVAGGAMALAEFGPKYWSLHCE